jgi:methionyl-tRNA synthetase
MSARRSYFITTPIYYVNDSPHIGHAYTTLSCDVLARFMRLDGCDVHFLTGTDEHGQKVEKSAAAAGLDPQAFTDRVSAEFKALAETLNCSFDNFIRTTEPRHIRSCQALWRKLVDNGEIYLGKYAGWYAVRDEAFYAESELVDGKAPTGADVEWVEEPSYFFRLSAWQDRLLAFYDANPDCIGPRARRNEVISFVKSGLLDLSVSRTSFKWGVPVPGDPAHIMYVWLDALTNYITEVGYPDVDGEMFRRYWPADLHMVGKDILRFHTVYWHAFLMAAGVAPPKRVFAHGWWTNEGQKISKSLGNVIDPLKLVDEFGLDPVRYFLFREVPFGNDGNFAREQMIKRINADLANGLGNLSQRVLTLIGKHCGAAVPTPGALGAADQALIAAANGLLGAVRTEMEQQAFHRALELIWNVVGDADRYIDEQAPWTLRKTDPPRMATVLYVLAEVIRHLGILVQPFMPGSASKILDQLGLPADARGFDKLGPAHALAAGATLPAPAPVFPRYVAPEAAAE